MEQKKAGSAGSRKGRGIVPHMGGSSTSKGMEKGKD